MHAIKLALLALVRLSHHSKESHQEAAMEQKPSSLVLIGLLATLCAGPGHALALRLLNGGLEFSFGSKAATAGAETEPLDPSLGDDYENEISHVEFEPELGSAAPYAAAAAGPATGPVRARNTAAGRHSMKWWLPPSTMPSFPLLPNPVGMPGPGIPGLPLPGMPFHPIGGWGAPAPPATETTSTNVNDPNASGGGVN